MVKIANYFDTQKTDHEKWFEYCYLFSLGLRNKRINKNDFEGIICDKDNNEIAIFELKLVSLNNIQERVNKNFEENKNSNYLQPMPEYENIKSQLKQTISKAENQLLNRLKEKKLARIIFIIRNTPDFNKDDLIDVIKSNRCVVFCNNQTYFTYDSKVENEEVLDLFYDKRISGLICLTIESEQDYTSIIIKNKKASIPISDIFIKKAEFLEEI